MLAWGGSICWVGQGPVGYVGPPFLTASAASLLSSLFCFLLLTLSQAVSSSLGGLSIHLAAGEASAFLPVTPRAKIFPDSALPDLTPCSTRMPTQRPCSCCAHAVCPHRIWVKSDSPFLAFCAIRSVSQPPCNTWVVVRSTVGLCGWCGRLRQYL